MRSEAIGIKRFQAPNHQEDYVQVPPWLTIMYNTVYFDTCLAHPNTKKNELDRFCIDCLLALCCHCLTAHACHKYVKIRRYVYCEVINRKDLCKLFNCSGIQAYHTNKTKVLFLKQRPQQLLQQQSRQHNSKDHSCIICQRNLQDASLYCSIACKVSSINRDEHEEEIMPGHDNPSNENDQGLKNNKSSDREILMQNPCNEKDEGLKSKEILTQSSPKRQKVRKGVAQRAPMF